MHKNFVALLLKKIFLQSNFILKKVRLLVYSLSKILFNGQC